MTEEILVQHHDVAQLVGLAADGLRSMYDDTRGAFCRSVSPGRQGLRRVGVSFRGSLVAALGLHQVSLRGYWTPISTSELAQFLAAHPRAIRSSGDLGLLLWMCARITPERLERVFEEIDLRLAVDAHADGRSGRTISLAWLLAGLSEARLALGPGNDVLDEVTRLTRQLLFVNYGGHGIVADRARRSLTRPRGYFPDQAFAAYAFARYARVFQDEPSLLVAQAITRQLVAKQGALGQWAWRYDPSDGKVVETYPLHSVHQYALGPMALVEVGRLTGEDYRDAIFASLAWVRFGNERKIDLVDAGRNVVWDGLAPARLRMPWKPVSRLSVMETCRPEHLGWLLYALSGGIQRAARREPHQDLITIS